MQFDNRENIIAITPLWKGERFPDGRPKVPDKYLDALYQMTLEELWKPIFVQGYENQFIAMKSLHPEFKEDGSVNRKMVGRALTAIYAPTRPDYYNASFSIASAQGYLGTPNQWVIELLTDRDVLVVDMFDKVYKGTFLGGNLTTALKTKTGSGGAVIWGGIRDLEQMQKVPDVQVYYRGIDPTPIRDFVLLNINAPARLSVGREAAICLPGDVVYGCSGGVLFIPPHLVVDVVEGGEKTKVKDLFGFQMITENRFTTAQIDKNTWTEEMLDLLVDFIKKDPLAAEYRGLDWSKEYDLARNGDPNDTQSAL
ncbi:MAG: RraA family protein [Eubacteriales bacterium]|nr:RraA family protein [Eubacteriales bacterium]